MEFWLVSPNINSSGGKTLERWKGNVRSHHAVFMGWPRERARDGAQRLGQIFAGNVDGGVRWGDLILSAYRQDWQWHVVGCGRVSSETGKDSDLSDGLDYQTHRELEPFVPMQDTGKLVRMFKGTTADGGNIAHRRRVIPALVRLKPESNSADERLLNQLMRLLKVAPRTTELARTPLGVDQYLRASPSQRKVILPRHRRLSNAFANWLEHHRYEKVPQEHGYIDLDFVEDGASCRAELKICHGVNTRQAIREAIGQLLEYNYHPHMNREPAEKWFLVLDRRPTKADIEYLGRLRNLMKFPLSLCWRSSNSFAMKRW